MIQGPRDAGMLAALAEPVCPRRVPFYMRRPPGGQPAGWYWQPADSERLHWLGGNVIWAERRLLELVARRAGEQAPAGALGAAPATHS